MTNIFGGDIPKSILMYIVSAQASVGNLSSNPFVFNAFNLSYLSVTLDGNQTPYAAWNLKSVDDEHTKSLVTEP